MWLCSHVKEKLIKSRLTDGLKIVTFYLALTDQKINWQSRDGEKRVELR